MTLPTESYHSRYNDSDADLVIECKDGIKLRVQSYILKAHSEFFRNMPSPTDIPAGDGAIVVNLDCDSDDLALMLDLIDKFDCGNPTWTQLAGVLKVGERYHFKHMPDLVRLRASHCITGSTAVDIFRFAGSNGFHDLARLAIASFWKDQNLIIKDFDNIPGFVCDDVPGRYGAALIVAVAEHPRMKGLTPQVRWERISASFNVK